MLEYLQLRLWVWLDTNLFYILARLNLLLVFQDARPIQEQEQSWLGPFTAWNGPNHKYDTCVYSNQHFILSF